MSGQNDYDFLHHALTYRRSAKFGISTEFAWQKLLACHNRIVARAVEQSEKDTARMQFLEDLKGLEIFSSVTEWTREDGTTFKSRHVLSGNGTQYGPAPTLRETIDAAMLIEAKK